MITENTKPWKLKLLFAVAIFMAISGTIFFMMMLGPISRATGDRHVAYVTIGVCLCLGIASSWLSGWLFAMLLKKQRTWEDNVNNK